VSTFSTHVLDTARGCPAVDLPIRIEGRDGHGWILLDEGVTNNDGRVSLMPDGLEPGVYQLNFDTAEWFAARGVKTFYPVVSIVFEITASDQHYHVPLLLSPYGYSTYRGS